MSSLTELGAIGAPANGLGSNALGGSAELVSSTQFLELLVAQMQNQNPFEPLEGTEFVTQLAEFASLEQLTGVNDGLDQVSRGLGGMASQNSIQMLGREVTFPGNGVVLPEQGDVTLNYRLGSAASDLTIVVYDQLGIEQGVITRAPRSAGLNQLDWDGTVLTDSGEVRLEPGSYRFEVEAANGEEPVNAETVGSGRVTGITFENGQPVLMLGDDRIVPGNVISVAE